MKIYVKLPKSEYPVQLLTEDDYRLFDATCNPDDEIEIVCKPYEDAKKVLSDHNTFCEDGHSVKVTVAQFDIATDQCALLLIDLAEAGIKASIRPSDVKLSFQQYSKLYDTFVQASFKSKGKDVKAYYKRLVVQTIAETRKKYYDDGE